MQEICSALPSPNQDGLDNANYDKLTGLMVMLIKNTHTLRPWPDDRKLTPGAIVTETVSHLVSVHLDVLFTINCFPLLSKPEITNIPIPQ
jgi:hypothetical protein